MIESFTYSLYLLLYKRYKVCPATSCGPCKAKMLKVLTLVKIFFMKMPKKESINGS